MKFRAKWIFLVYIIMLAFTYLAGYAYWERQEHLFWICRVAEGDACSILKPDGPMFAVLALLIPAGMTILYGIISLSIYRKTRK
jgi:hypothetical protein